MAMSAATVAAASESLLLEQRVIQQLQKLPRGSDINDALFRDVVQREGEKRVNELSRLLELAQFLDSADEAPCSVNNVSSQNGRIEDEPRSVPEPCCQTTADVSCVIDGDAVRRLVDGMFRRNVVTYSSGNGTNTIQHDCESTSSIEAALLRFTQRRLAQLRREGGLVTTLLATPSESRDDAATTIGSADPPARRLVDFVRHHARSEAYLPLQLVLHPVDEDGDELHDVRVFDLGQHWGVEGVIERALYTALAQRAASKIPVWDTFQKQVVTPSVRRLIFSFSQQDDSSAAAVPIQPPPKQFFSVVHALATDVVSTEASRWFDCRATNLDDDHFADCLAAAHRGHLKAILVAAALVVFIDEAIIWYWHTTRWSNITGTSNSSMSFQQALVRETVHAVVGLLDAIRTSIFVKDEDRAASFGTTVAKRLCDCLSCIVSERLLYPPALEDDRGVAASAIRCCLMHHVDNDCGCVGCECQEASERNNHRERVGRRGSHVMMTLCHAMKEHVLQRCHVEAERACLWRRPYLRHFVASGVLEDDSNSSMGHPFVVPRVVSVLFHGLHAACDAMGGLLSLRSTLSDDDTSDSTVGSVVAQHARIACDIWQWFVCEVIQSFASQFDVSGDGDPLKRAALQSYFLEQCTRLEERLGIDRDVAGKCQLRSSDELVAAISGALL